MVIELLGWLGALLLMICALPQTLKCIKTKSAAGVDLGFLIMWWLGAASMMVYQIYNKDVQASISLGFNVVFVSIMLYYKLRYKA